MANKRPYPLDKLDSHPVKAVRLAVEGQLSSEKAFNQAFDPDYYHLLNLAHDAFEAGQSKIAKKLLLAVCWASAAKCDIDEECKTFVNSITAK